MDQQKQMGFLFPVMDALNLWRGRRQKGRCVPEDWLEHRKHVARDATRLIASVMPANLQDTQTQIGDVVRKLLILHLGDPRSALWGDFFNDEAYQRIAAMGSTFFQAWGNVYPDSAYEDNDPDSVAAEYWVHLFEFLRLDYRVAPGTDEVTFAGRGVNEAQRQMQHMPYFARAYRQARSFGVQDDDFLLVLFCAGALRNKNGLQTLQQAHRGVGIDKDHARLKNVAPERLQALWDNVRASRSYDWNSEGSPTNNEYEGKALQHYKDDWEAVLNFVHVGLPEVGIVQPVPPGEYMFYESTEAGRVAAAGEEELDRAEDGNEGDAPGFTEDYRGDQGKQAVNVAVNGDGGEGGEEYYDGEGGEEYYDGEGGEENYDGEGAEEGGEEQPPAVPPREDIGRRIGAARDKLQSSRLIVNEAMPRVSKVLSAKHADRAMQLATAALVGRQLAGGANATADRVHALLGDAPHAKAIGASIGGQSLSAVDASARGVRAGEFYAFALGAGHLASATGQTAPAAVRRFVAAVYEPGSAERPVDTAHQVADWLTVFGNGADPKLCGSAWTSLWRGGHCSISERLRASIARYVAGQPMHVPAQDAQEVVSRIASAK